MKTNIYIHKRLDAPQQFELKKKNCRAKTKYEWILTFEIIIILN